VAEAAKTIGVAGAGTMGAGIAQLACLAGARTLLHDPVPEALERGLEQIRGHLKRGAERGRWSAEDAAAAADRLAAAPGLEDLAPCELVIEAAPERLELKQQLFARLSEGIVSDSCVLATNTSSLLVTAVASAATHPARVVGMHFFNPAPLMRLLEVVAGVESAADALAVARATGKAMGKIVIDAVDGPGFLVNRCNRPFGLESARLLTDRVATIEEIDRICRVAGGFRMGPFELSDLVGVDVGLEVARSFFEQSFADCGQDGGRGPHGPQVGSGLLRLLGRHGRLPGARSRPPAGRRGDRNGFDRGGLAAGLPAARGGGAGGLGRRGPGGGG